MLMIWTFMCHTTAIWVTETYCASKTMETSQGWLDPLQTGVYVRSS